jgi:hypothetical protein
LKSDVEAGVVMMAILVKISEVLTVRWEKLPMN